MLKLKLGCLNSCWVLCAINIAFINLTDHLNYFDTDDDDEADQLENVTLNPFCHQTTKQSDIRVQRSSEIISNIGVYSLAISKQAL